MSSQSLQSGNLHPSASFENLQDLIDTSVPAAPPPSLVSSPEGSANTSRQISRTNSTSSGLQLQLHNLEPQRDLRLMLEFPEPPEDLTNSDETYPYILNILLQSGASQFHIENGEGHLILSNINWEAINTTLTQHLPASIGHTLEPITASNSWALTLSFK